MPKCHGYRCNCTSEHDVTKGKLYDTCGCGHTVPHKGKQTTVYERIREADPVAYDADMDKYAEAVSVSKTVLTPAEARAKLRAAGIPVGKRGRLSPEQMAQAAKL